MLDDHHNIGHKHERRNSFSKEHFSQNRCTTIASFAWTQLCHVVAGIRNLLVLGRIPVESLRANDASKCSTGSLENNHGESHGCIPDPMRLALLDQHAKRDSWIEMTSACTSKQLDEHHDCEADTLRCRAGHITPIYYDHEYACANELGQENERLVIVATGYLHFSSTLIYA